MRKTLRITKTNVGMVLLVLAMLSSIFIGFWAYLVGIPAYFLLAPRIWSDMVEMAEQQLALMGFSLDERDKD